MCFAALVFRPPQPAEFDDAFAETARPEVAQVCSLALPEDLSGPAVLSPTGTALLQATH